MTTLKNRLLRSEYQAIHHSAKKGKNLMNMSKSRKLATVVEHDTDYT